MAFEPTTYIAVLQPLSHLKLKNNVSHLSLIFTQVSFPYIFSVQVNLKALDLKAEIVRALTTTTLPLNHRGSSSMVQIGHVGMSKVQITENLMRVIQILDQRFPGGFKNVRSLHLKTEKSMAIPVHISSSKILFFAFGSFELLQMYVTLLG